MQFRYGQQIERLEHAGGEITGVQIDGRLVTADRYVLALGSYSADLLLSLGLHLPVYPLKGYSLTIPDRGRATRANFHGAGRELQDRADPLR